MKNQINREMILTPLNIPSQKCMIPSIQPMGYHVTGYWEEYRPGKFRVRFYWKGQRFELYRYLDGNPLVHKFYAQRLLEHINSLIDSKKFDPSYWVKAKPYLWENALETWISLSDCSQEWIRQRRRIARKYLTPHFSGFDIREINDINLREFLAWLRKQGLKDKTVYNVMGELKAFCNFHKTSIGKILEWPVIRFQEPPIHWLNEEQQNKVFEAIPSGDRPIFDFMRYTGCRPNEACGLLRENVFLDQGYFVLATVKGEYADSLKPNTKTKVSKPLPIIPEIERALKPAHLGKFVFMHFANGKLIPYSKGILWRIWKKVNTETHKAQGVPIVGMYQGLKHSFGCQRLNQGYPLEAIKDIMGHTSTKTTQRYAKYKMESLANVMSGKVVEIGQGANRVQAEKSGSKI